MCRAYGVGCGACSGTWSRRTFLGRCGAAVAAGLTLPLAQARSAEKPVRVAAVFLANSQEREIWPYPGFDCQGRQQQVMKLLAEGCPGVEFVPVVVAQPADAQKALALKDSVDGYLAYVVTLNWGLTGVLHQLARLHKPYVVANEFLGGCGVFLVGVSGLRRNGIPVAAVSSTRPDDLLAVARFFAQLRQPGMTPATFAQRCEAAYRATFARPGAMVCREDRPTLTPISECVKRLKESRFLVVGAGPAGQQRDFLGAKGIYVGFPEFRAFYDQVDPEQARSWAHQWSSQAEKVVEAKPEWIHKAGAVYLAMLALMKKYGTDSITINCLGGFASGQLPAYPCLGFMQINNDGGQGVCEAMPDDSISFLLGRILAGRAGYVSDPTLDTSKNQIVYAHCMALTKAFGPTGPANPYRIRTLHNRDPRGCCPQSFLPEGYMTTSFRTNVAAKLLVLHQAKAVGNLDADRGCRTQLVGEVRGDIGKMFAEWDRFGWHRVTIYGDLREPLIELAKALGLTVIEEA